MENKIEIHNMNLHYGDFHALHDINLDIKEKEITAFIGPSGCGKSTLLRLISGLIPMDDGSLTLDGTPINAPGADRGFMFQEHTLFPWLSIYDNIAFGLRARGIYKQEKDRVDEFIKMVGLRGFEHSYPHQLSGGMLQRIMIGIAMSMEPSLLIADEPTTAIDAITQFDILNEFAAIKQKHKTAMIFISHDLNAVSQIADKIVVLNQGTVVDQGDFHHIIHHAADPYTRLLIEKRTDVMRKYRQALEGGECSHAQAG